MYMDNLLNWLSYWMIRPLPMGTTYGTMAIMCGLSLMLGMSVSMRRGIGRAGGRMYTKFKNRGAKVVKR